MSEIDPEMESLNEIMKGIGVEVLKELSPDDP
jgi:hypothetical protein